MGYINTVVILGGINIIAALGLAILTGYTGLFSIGHSGFMALGGYMAAALVMELQVPFIPALIGGGLFAGLCSLLIGYPTFRSQLRGDYFAIATFGFAEAVRLLLNNTYSVIGGSYGYQLPPRTNLPLVLGVVVVALLLAHSFVRSQYGKNCIAVKEDAVAARMMGVNVLRTQLTALFISAFYAGVAGGLFGFYMAYLSPSMFTLTRSSDLLAAVVFGGMQSLIGPLLAAFVLVAVPEVLRVFTDWRLIVYGVMFVIIMVFRPQGLLGYKELNLDFIGRFIERLLAWVGRMGRRKAETAP
ncbi:MAG TPA: branched-chain amino acid ABC transporter permease [Chloroflexi bacterium]|jgi:branched-chain amino acid transport system permease protein|nr:branched-chain amino acid ABC transporter permease [Chloroflexota bacterium]